MICSAVYFESHTPLCTVFFWFQVFVFVCFTDGKGCPDMYFQAKILFMNNDEIERKQPRLIN